MCSQYVYKYPTHAIIECKGEEDTPTMSPYLPPPLQIYSNFANESTDLCFSACCVYFRSIHFEVNYLNIETHHVVVHKVIKM